MSLVAEKLESVSGMQYKTAHNALKSALEYSSLDFSKDGVRANVDKWEKNKKSLLEAFSQHPGWNPDALAIVSSIIETRTTDTRAAVTNLKEMIHLLYEEMDILPATDENNKSRKMLAALTELSNTLLNEKNITQRGIDRGVNYIPDLFIKPSVGMKSSRLVLKNLEAIGIDLNKRSDLIRPFNDYTNAISPYTMEHPFVLSLNPADYALMSNGNTWSSCHSISGNDDGEPEGQYASGTFSYMVDSSSVVAYTVESLPDDMTRLCLREKFQRQMFMIHPSGKIFVQSRMYPVQNGNDPLYRLFRKEVHDILSTIYGFENQWAKPSKGRANIIAQQDNLHYPDYYYVDCVRTSFTTDLREEFDSGEFNRSIRVGATPLCVECGDSPLRENSLRCDGCRPESDYEW